MRIIYRYLKLLVLTGSVWLVTGFLAFGRSASLPESAYASGVIGHPQTFTLSCESRSAVDWARFFGVSISEVEFLNRLPRSDNPNAGFVGDPNGIWGGTPPHSYGVHARPVADLLRAYGLKAEARQNLSWDDLRYEIASGRPVIVWVIGQMWGGNGLSYTALDGETVRVAPFEHTMILVGYDKHWAYAVDASTGWVQTYAVSAFIKSWGVLGNMAVTASEPEPEELAPPPPTETPLLPPPPVATPAPYEFLMLDEPWIYYFPMIAQPVQYASAPEKEVVEGGVCLFTQKGVLWIKPARYFRGWCVSAQLLRPEYLLNIAGPIPELP